MTEIFVCKIPLENIPKRTITVFSQWDDSSFSLKIIHSGNAWEKKLSSETVKSMSSFTQYNPAEYILETKRALTTNEGNKDFTYSLIESEFSWKKLVDKDENIRVKYGSVLLEKATISSVADTMIDFLVKHNISTEERTNKLEKENTDLKMVNSNLRAQVNNMVSSKNEMEETLYSKFTCLLNTKKEKILKLEENIQNIEKGKIIRSTEETKETEKDPYGSETEMESEEEKINSFAAKKLMKDEYGSETEIDTDEERMGPSSAKIKKLGSMVLSSQKYNLKNVTDDSSCHSEPKMEDNKNFQEAFPTNQLENARKDLSKTSDKKDNELWSAGERNVEDDSKLQSSPGGYVKFNIKDLLEEL